MLNVLCKGYSLDMAMRQVAMHMKRGNLKPSVIKKSKSLVLI